MFQDLQSITKKTPLAKAKRTNKPGGERGPNPRKKNKKEDVGKSAEALMKQLKQVRGAVEMAFFKRLTLLACV